MKKIVLVIMLILALGLSGCDKKEEVREFEQKIEIFEDANIIHNYIKLAKSEGFKYYSFIDIRAYETELDGYPKTKSYCYGYIDYFDNAAWTDNFYKDFSKYVKKPKSYPIIIIDYDGSYIDECISLLESKGYTNIKAFKNGFYDTKNNYIDQKGFESLVKCEDCGC